MTITRMLPVLFAACLLAGAVPRLGSVHASSLLTASVVAPAAVPAGTDAWFTVRTEGEDPESARLEFAVTGGTLQGITADGAVRPGLAETRVAVRRDTPGEATLRVSSGGAVLASGTAVFAAEGRITVRVALAAEAHASARTWRFELRDASGSLLEALSVGTSGAAPVGEARSGTLPYGAYTVRQVLGNDTGLECTGRAFYRVASPAGTYTRVELAGAAGTAVFEIEPCPSAPGSLGVSIPIDTLADPEPPIDQVRGVRAPGPAPLPPATGSGLAPRAGGPAWLLLLAGALLASPLPAFAAARVARRM